MTKKRITDFFGVPKAKNYQEEDDASRASCSIGRVPESRLGSDSESESSSASVTITIENVSACTSGSATPTGTTSATAADETAGSPAALDGDPAPDRHATQQKMGRLYTIACEHGLI